MLRNIYNNIKNNFHRSYNRGLTLIELIVVISIFLVITSTVIFDYGNFKSNVSLQNLTDDIALAIRKAQSFAIGARAVDTSSGTADFSRSYGVHFSTDSTTVGTLDSSTKSFLMFSADPSNKEYDNSTSTGACGDSTQNNCIEAFNITTSDYIKEIWIDGVLQSPGATLDIIFSRPNPRAYFCFRPTMSSSCVSASYVQVKISNGQLLDKEKTKIISVQNTGQISIQ